jgi:hypothetical protein
LICFKGESLMLTIALIVGNYYHFWIRPSIEFEAPIAEFRFTI